MTKKFTEEQYQKIRNVDFTFIPVEQSYNLLDVILDESIRPGSEQMNMALALSNPLTCEWAHNKFVEKEERYVWTSKEVNSSGKHKRLFIQQQSASVRDYFILDKHGYDNNELITESEIKKWGYAPERFYKEEV